MAQGNELVLVTGATGHVGYAVLVKTLEAGYNVRATVRDPSKAEAIVSSTAIKALGLDPNKLSFITVSDITEPGAFDEVLNDITHIIHVASPLGRPSFNNFQNDIINPAVKGTKGVLKSALNVPSVKRIVITSSTSANTNSFEIDDNPEPVRPDYRRPDYQEGFVVDSKRAYAAAKTAALNATDNFMREKSPHFDVINIMPALVFGPKGLSTSPNNVISGSNIFGIGLVMRKGSWKDVRTEAMSCHVEDVAEAHVNALNPDITGNQDFALSTTFEPQAVHEIVRQKFPREVQEDGIFSGTNSYSWFHIAYDIRKTEELLLKRKLRGPEEQIIDSANQVLELLKG